jgi:hypothetical protein
MRIGQRVEAGAEHRVVRAVHTPKQRLTVDPHGVELVDDETRPLLTALSNDVHLERVRRQPKTPAVRLRRAVALCLCLCSEYHGEYGEAAQHRWWS